MKCTYTYTFTDSAGLRITLSANSVEELRDQVLKDERMMSTFNEAWIDKNFIFYDTGKTPDETRAIVDLMKSKAKSKKNDSVTVTSLAKDNSYQGKGMTLMKTDEFSRTSDLCLKFSLDFGTYIHKAIELDIQGIVGEEWEKEVLKPIRKLIKDFNDIITRNPELKNTILNNLKNFIGLIGLFCEAWNSKPDGELQMLINAVVSNIKSVLLTGKTVVVLEENIIQQDKNGSGTLHGKPDLVLMDGSGKLIIVDFKTSTRDSMSDATKKYHYIQLQAYKKIFGSWGIPESNVTGQNVLITFSPSGINFDPDSGIINPEEDQLSGEVINEVHHLLNRFFPIEIQGIPEDRQEKLNIVKKRHTAFCSGLMLKRYSEESMSRTLLERAKNNRRVYLYSQDKVVELKLEKDRIVAYDINDSSKMLLSEKIEDLVKKEQDSIQKRTEQNTQHVKTLLLEKDPSKLKDYFAHNPDGSKSLWQNLYKYCSMSYEYVSCPELETLGIIVMKHATRGYEFILLVSDASNLLFCLNPNENILRSVITDKKVLQKYKESGELERGSIGNLYAIRAMLAIAEFKDSFPDFKISQINVVSINSGQSVGVISNENIRKTFLVLLQCSKDAPQLENTKLFTDCYDKVKSIQMSSVDELWAYTLVDALSAASQEYGDTSLSLSNWKDMKNIEAKLERLELIQEHIEQRYKEIVESIDNTGKSKSNESIIYVYNLCKTLLNQLRNMVENENAMNSYSVNFQESIVAGINLLTKGSIAEFTKSGLQLTGLAQGLSSSSAYSSPSKLIQRFLHFYDVATSLIMLELSKEMSELNKATEKFISWGKKNGHVFADSIRGNHDKLYSSLFQLSKDGINSDMLFLNPYSKDCKLSQEQKEYLEVILWTINRHKAINVGDASGSVRRMSYAELKLNPKDFERYKEIVSQNSKFLEIPLKKKGGIQGTASGLMSVIRGKKTLGEFTKDEVKKCRSIIEHEFLDDSQESERDRVAKERKRYINYFKENELNRNTRTENARPEEWDWNMNNVVVEYALADLKLKYFDQLLKIADNQFAVITILEQTTGQDLSKQTQELIDRIQVSIYNKSLVQDEFKDVVSAMGFVKSAMAYTKIAIRPALLVKEMILGRVRNTAAILTKQISQDEGKEITMSHLLDAAKEVFGPNFFKEKSLKILGQLPMGHKSMADLLNDTYAINDRDLSVIGDKFSYDSYGIHNWASRMLYMNTIAPDWFNRMIIFVAKMKADGTWDAHKIGENGELIYDISKDKRVAEYWNNRNNPKNTTEYLKAKEYYILKMQQFEREGYTNPDGSPLQYSDAHLDPFPRAYTTQEEESIKEQIGLIYGYYSHQERSTMQRGLWWTMYTNFMTYMPSEIRKYFAIGKDSSIVKTIHKKDGITGKPLYWKNSKEGELTEMTTEGVDKETGKLLRPVLETVNDPYQGIITSTVRTVGQVCRGEFDQIKQNPKQLRLIELFLFNLLFGALVAAILMAIGSNASSSSGPAISAISDVLTKSSRELDFYHAVLEPVGGLGFVGTDFLNNVFTSSYKAISTDGYSLLDFANSNFAIVKDLHLNLDLE